jgi:hypothetical protein
MPLVQLPDGTLVQLPDGPKAPLPPSDFNHPAELFRALKDETVDRGKSVLKGGGKLLDMLAGFAQSAAFAVPPEEDIKLGAGPTRNLLTGVETPSTMTEGLGPAAEKAFPGLPIPANPNVIDKLRQYSQAGFEAAPGALLAGPQAGAAILPSIVSGMSGAAGGDAAAAVSPTLRPYGQLAGSVLGGTAMGMASAAAKRPPESELKNLQTDQGLLTRLGADRVGPEVSPGAVANQSSAAANALEKYLGQQASQTWKGELAGAPPIPPTAVAGVYKQLKAAASSTPVETEANAYNKIAELLLDKRGGQVKTITDPETLSRALKQYSQFKPTQNAAFSATDAEVRAARAAEELLGNQYFPLARADTKTAQFHQQVVNPLKESPIGSLADSNPLKSDPTAVGRLSTAVNSTDPQGVTDLLKLLKNQGANPQDIARAIVQKRLEGGGGMPDKALFGAPASAEEGRMTALLKAGGADPQAVRQPLALAETLGRASKFQPQDMTEYGRASVPVGGVGRLAALFRPPAFLTRNAEARLGDAQLKELMKTATPQEMALLEQLSKLKPGESPGMPVVTSALLGALSQKLKKEE